MVYKMIDFVPILAATSQSFVEFIQSTLKEWGVEKYKWRFDPNWAGEIFVHVLVYNEDLGDYDHLMQFAYRSGRFDFQNINSKALEWLKENL